ncbi:hypothetical protein K3556_15450 [Aliiroseovarius sp. M344]|uniref:hypothetical protein n=1 Tax=Aliiroseovarius sp. M344 TaxID=2867010 RepID=UPI0021AD78E0|nr:hypothetical protein [Aliiroseovarius sp. M344]UWQ14279.1 hypothetical protein K3556_15450 [Aliiroseovarius sp. M344]
MTLEACDAAARPVLAEEDQNGSGQCLIENIDKVLTVNNFMPVETIAADEPANILRTSAGVAFTGSRIDGLAPVDAFLGAYTIAAFDDSGDHVNLPVGYHCHPVTNGFEH